MYQPDNGDKIYAQKALLKLSMVVTIKESLRVLFTLVIFSEKIIALIRQYF